MSLEMTAAAGSGHPTTSASISHLVTVLLFHTMRWSPDYPDYPTSDRLVLSEGHAVPAVYAACAELGVMYGKEGARRKLTVADLRNLRTAESELDGHPNPMEGFPFFDAATGSLGQGLSVAAGLGEAARLDNYDKKIYCIIGDGESREGQIAEALDYIVDRKLRNVLPIFNCNEYGQADRVSGQQSADTLTAKLIATGYEVKVIDGHNPAQIKAAFDAFRELEKNSPKPMALVAKTVKGWGSPSIQGGGWHGKPPAADQLKRALTELEAKRIELTSSLVSSDSFTIEPPPEYKAKDFAPGEIPALTDYMKKNDMESTLQAGTLATRRAYGLALRALGAANDRVVVLDADVSNSTYAEMFKKDASMAPRFMECKIAEQNMFSVGVGLSAGGKVPFASTFAKFVTRAYDQIEMAIYSGANLKIIGSHAGITLAADGPSQMSMPDVAWFGSFATMKDHRGNPGCYVLQPADAFAAYSLTQVMSEYEGVCYMRTLRAETEFLYNDETVFNLGGFEVLNKGKDIVLAAAGYMVHEANKALELLDKAGVSASVVDLYSLPFDTERFLDLVQQSGGNVLTIEDNFGGGIGAAVAGALLESGDGFRLRQMHVTRIPKSARTPDEVLKMCGLTADDIKKAAMQMLGV
jgi:transketolase